MESLAQDFRYAVRGLRTQPGYAALAVLTLALGIGATTAMFSVIYNVLFDPFPYLNVDRIVMIQVRQADRAHETGRSWYQASEFLDYTERSRVFEEVIATGYEDILLTTPEGTAQFGGALFSQNMFTFLGVPALLGRTLTADDAKPDASPAFVMAYTMWTKHYNSDPTVVGRTFVLNGVPTTCVGVMPRRFTKLAADLYKPIVFDRGNAAIKDQYFMFQARMKPGVTLAQVEADVSVLAQQIAKDYPRNYPPDGKFVIKAVSWLDNLIGPFRQTLTTLGAAVALLLLIACTNVANLLLARATSREKEMALRAALGATRGRLIRQLLIESLVLALLGAVAGCAFAWLGMKTLVTYIPDGSIPREVVIRLNGPVLLFSLGVAVLTALVFGLVPALQTARKDLVEPLKDSDKGATGGFRRGKLRAALVVLEVVSSVVLLACAGLLMRSFVKLAAADLGFEPNNLLTARLALPRGQYDSPEKKKLFFEQAISRVRAVPGVTSAAMTTTFPIFGGPESEIEIPGGKAHTERWSTLVAFATDGIFQTLGTRLVRGRLPDESEFRNGRKVIVVNQEFVRRYLPNVEPVGQMVRFKILAPRAGSGPAASAAQGPPPENPAFEIAGVVVGARNREPSQPTAPEAIIPSAAAPQFEGGLLIRTAANPLALVNTIRREIWGQDRGVAVTNIDTLGNLMRQYVYATPRFSLIVLGVFAAVGLVLVALGIYSVVAYTVSRQTHEIGIRMALGASRGDVMRLVLRLGLGLVVLGAVAGLLVSLGLTRMLSLTNRLAQVPPNDPVTLAFVFLVITASGFCACYFPARRATKVDPMIALRHG